MNRKGKKGKQHFSSKSAIHKICSWVTLLRQTHVPQPNTLFTLMLKGGSIHSLFVKGTLCISNAAPKYSEQKVNPQQLHQRGRIHSFRSSDTKDKTPSGSPLTDSHAQFTGLQVWRPQRSATWVGAIRVTESRRGIKAQQDWAPPTLDMGPLCTPLIPHSPTPAMTAWLTIGHTMGGRVPPPGREWLPPTCKT